MGVSAILPVSTAFVPKIVVPTKLCSSSGPVDMNPPKQHILLDYQHSLQHLRQMQPLFSPEGVQGKAILLGGTTLRVWLPFPRPEPHEPEEPFSVLNALGIRLFRALILTLRSPWFPSVRRSCTSLENLPAFALCFSAFGEPSRVLCFKRV